MYLGDPQSVQVGNAATTMIIITYIYHALNALRVHMMHINLNAMFYTHVEHSPTKTVYIRYYMEKQTRTCTRACAHTHTHTLP